MSIEIDVISPWIKAKRSDGSGECVEMRRNCGVIELRDSKNPEGPTLRYTSAEFAAWLDGAKRGQFDDLL